MGNVQSDPTAGGGSRKEQASDRASDSRRTSLVEPEVTPSSPAMRLARGLGVGFPGSSATPGLLIPQEPQASPAPLPLTLERPSPVTPLPEEAAVAAVSTTPPAPAGTLPPAPSKWRKHTGTPVPRIRGLMEASYRGQGDPPSLRPLPPLPRQLTEKGPVPRPPTPPPRPLEPRKPPPPPDPRPPNSRLALATSTTSPPESRVRPSSEGQAACGAPGAAPPQAGEGEMARSAASKAGLNLLCKVTFKSGSHSSSAATSGPLAAKASPGSGRSRGLFTASSAISYAEALKQGTRPPAASRPLGEVPCAAQEPEGGDGDGECCSDPPSTPAPHVRALPPPPYTTFRGAKPKFDWVNSPEGTERHFRFNGAAGGNGAPRRRAATLSGTWGSPPTPAEPTHPAPGPRRSPPALLAPPTFIFPAPTNGEPSHPGSPGPQQTPLPPPPTVPAAPPPAPPPAPQPPSLQRTPLLVVRPPTPGHVESAPVPAPAPVPPSTLAADQTTPPTLASAPIAAEPSMPVPPPIKTRTRRNKGSRATRGVIREDGAPTDHPRDPITATAKDSVSGAGSKALTAETSNKGAAHRWPPFQVLHSCPCKCYCRHQPRQRRLPRNVSAWLSTPTNHLSEPPWVATIKLAGSLVAGLEHYDLQTTHSN